GGAGLQQEGERAGHRNAGDAGGHLAAAGPVPTGDAGAPGAAVPADAADAGSADAGPAAARPAGGLSPADTRAALRRTGPAIVRRCGAADDGCAADAAVSRSEEHTSELQSRGHLVCRLLLEKKKKSSA